MMRKSLIETNGFKNIEYSPTTTKRVLRNSFKSVAVNEFLTWSIGSINWSKTWYLSL